MVVFAPHGEVAEALPMVRLAIHMLLVSVDVVGVEFLATTIADKHMATELLCPPTLIPSSNKMNSLTNLPSKPIGPGASK